jgi:hypothetical protein
MTWFSRIARPDTGGDVYADETLSDQYPSTYLRDDNAALINLSGKTVTFYMREEEDPWQGPDGSSTIKVNGSSATVDDAAVGKVHYEWTSGDVDTAGVYDAWFEVDGALAYPRFRIEIYATRPSQTVDYRGYGGIGTLKS